MSVGERIAEMRKAKELSQREFAEKVNVSQSMIAQIERGSKVPTVILANEIAKALGGELEDLVR